MIPLSFLLRSKFFKHVGSCLILSDPVSSCLIWLDLVWSCPLLTNQSWDIWSKPLRSPKTQGTTESNNSSLFVSWSSWNHRYGDRWVLGNIYNMKNQFWAVGWAGLWKKKVWANYEQLLRPVFWAKNLSVSTKILTVIKILVVLGVR